MLRKFITIFIFGVGAIFVILSLICFSSQSINKRISDSIETKIPTDLKAEYEDSHGGFHGDGDTFAKVRLIGKSAEKVIIEIKDKWKPLPLSENLNLIMYGGIKDNIEYSYNLAEKFQIPHIEHGYWYFIDRHSKSAETYYDANLFERNSINFTLALYDADTSILYYLELDT